MQRPAFSLAALLEQGFCSRATISGARSFSVGIFSSWKHTSEYGTTEEDGERHAGRRFKDPTVQMAPKKPRQDSACFITLNLTMGVLEGKKYVVTGRLIVSTFELTARSTLTTLQGGARGIGLAFCKAIVEAGGEVGILDILPEPHPDCAALVQDGKCKYYM
jgi:hypothetical protein